MEVARHILGQSTSDTSNYLKTLVLEHLAEGGLILADFSVPGAILFDLADTEFPIAINVLSRVPDEFKPAVVDAVLETLLSVWQYGDFPATLVIDCLTNALYALLDYPDGSLLGVKYLLTSKKYREKVTPHIKNPIVKEYWENEFEKLSAKEKAELTRSTRTNIHQMIADPRIRNIIAGKQKLSFSDILNQQRVVLVRLPRKGFGKKNVKLIGSLVLASAYIAILTRKETKPFHIYIDHCDRYDTPVLSDMLAVLPGEQVSMTFAHAYLDQLSEMLKDALFGLCDFRAVFKIGIKDAAFIESNWKFNNTRTSTTDLAGSTAFLQSGEDFTDPTETHIPTASEENVNDERLRASTRRHFAKARVKVEATISKIIKDM